MNPLNADQSRRSFLIAGAAVTTAILAPAGLAHAERSTKPIPTTQRIPDRAVRKTTTDVRASVKQTLSAEQAAGNVVVDIDFQYQSTSYWCGPAATRMALSARGVYVSQQQMANELPTTTNGTDMISQVTNVLSNYVGWYETKQMPNDPPTQAQRDLLWYDITFDLDRGYALVANIVAPPSNHPPGYPDNQTIWHYFTVIGYNPVNQDVLIADPAGFAPTATYWLTFNQLATLIPPKGYSA